MEQWTAVHGIDQVPEIDERVGRHRHQAFADSNGEIQVEVWITDQVGHATAIDQKASCGFDPHTRTDFVTDAGLCATRWIARFWGLVESSHSPPRSENNLLLDVDRPRQDRGSSSPP
jgi:poly(3-hydroxybutyrate) depolymerase